MITSANLITYGMPNMAAYYSSTVKKLIDGKPTIARQMFKALSHKQKKAFFFSVSKEWQISAGDPAYDFFYEQF